MFKKIKKQWFILLLFSLWSSNNHAEIYIFACEPEWASLAKMLGGNQVSVFSATTSLQDPHHIQARPSLIAKARKADLLVCTGAELEIGWLPLLLRKSANGKIFPGQAGYFMAAEKVTLLEKPVFLDRSQGDVHAAGNPHIHLDPRRIMQIAKYLTNTLIKIDAKKQLFYLKNLDSFTDKWTKAIKQWQQKAKPLYAKRIVVNHNSWTYLESWLKLERIAILEPKPGIAPSSAYLSKVLARLKTDPADMIIYASYQSDKAASWLAKKTALPIIALPFSVAENEDLLQWFDKLINKLLEASI
ncbi:MAG: zinc ABC transporter substrate-binding protein [Pseudomonadota bacterium]